mmetsp:Transcript_24819/g.65179  ORF Transcript_24819/g.65179 Transcript_24819/m.65179 type:complete len:209 (+) Transcript_24819:1092-1718(+)
MLGWLLPKASLWLWASQVTSSVGMGAHELSLPEEAQDVGKLLQSTGAELMDAGQLVSLVPKSLKLSEWAASRCGRVLCLDRVRPLLVLSRLADSAESLGSTECLRRCRGTSVVDSLPLISAEWRRLRRVRLSLLGLLVGSLPCRRRRSSASGFLEASGFRPCCRSCAGEEVSFGVKARCWYLLRIQVSRFWGGSSCVKRKLGSFTACS